MPPEGSIHRGECEDIWKVMEIGYERLSKRGRIIMLGDFNARTGSLSSSATSVRTSKDVIIDSRGKELIQFCQRNDLIILNGHVRDSGFYTNREASVIDYVIIDEEWAHEVRGMKIVSEGKGLVKHNLQHELIQVGMPWVNTTLHKKKVERLQGVKRARCVINRSIPSADIQEVVNGAMKGQSDAIKGASSVEEAWGIFKGRVIIAADELKAVKIKKSEKWFEMSKEIDVVEEKMRVAVKGDSEWRILRQRRRKLKRKRRFEWERAELLNKVEGGKVWEFVDRLVGNTRREREFGSEGLVNEGGEIVLGNGVREVARKAWMSLGAEGRGDSEESKMYENELRDCESKFSEDDSERKEEDELSKPISREEVRTVLGARHLKKNKASDSIGFVNELFREGLEHTVDAILALFHRVFLEGCPNDWKVGIIIPIYKGAGCRKSVDNYRGISVLNVMSKIYCKILYNRLMTWAEKNNIIMEEQGGFRPHRGCRDQIYSLFEVLSVRKMNGEETYVCYVDFRKAYDNVWRRDLFVALWKAGVRGHMWRAIKRLYDEVFSCVCVNGYLTDLFNYIVGVRQGCILSPLLFSIYFNMMAMSLNNACKKLGIHIHIPQEDSVKSYEGSLTEYWLKNLWYADDLGLIAGTGEDLQLMLNELFLLTKKHRCFINESKTKVVIYGRKNNVSNVKDVWYVGDKMIERVSEYKYLGVWFDENLLFQKTIKERECKVFGAIEDLKTLGKNKVVNTTLALNVFYAKFIAIMEYGSVIWSVVMKRGDWNRLESKMRVALRAVLNLQSYEVHNVVLHGELGMPSFEGMVRKRRLLWWRSLENMSDTRLCKLIFRWARINQSRWWRAMNVIQVSINPGREVWNTPEWIEGWRSVEEGYWQAEVEDKVEKVSGLSLYQGMKKSLRREEYLLMEHYGYSSNFKRRILFFRQGRTDLYNWNKRGWKSKRSEKLSSCCEYCVQRSANSVMHVLGSCPRWNHFRVGVASLFDAFVDGVGGVQKFYSWNGSMSSWPIEKLMVLSMLGGGVFSDFDEEERVKWVLEVDKFMQKVENSMCVDEKRRIEICGVPL